MGEIYTEAAARERERERDGVLVDVDGGRVRFLDQAGYEVRK